MIDAGAQVHPDANVGRRGGRLVGVAAIVLGVGLPRRCQGDADENSGFTIERSNLVPI